jgi:CubicO group peptidase (beta-lactamase class C family)
MPPSSLHTVPPSVLPTPAAAPRRAVLVGFPNTPIGRDAAAWLQASNDFSLDDLRRFYSAHYSQSLLDKRSAEERADEVLRHRVHGRRTLFQVEHATYTEMSALIYVDVVGRFLRLRMRCEPNPPFLLVDSKADYVPSPPDLLEHRTLDPSEVAARLDVYVDKLVAHDLFSGSIAVARSGVILYARACGLANKSFGVPNRLDTKFNLGSMNKMFTSIAIGQLVQAGKLAYTDIIGSYISDYPNQDAARKVTIHQLLTHTSGLGDYFTDEYDRTPKDRLRSVKDYFPLFASKPLEFEPGTRFSYSNAGFMVLGAIIERVSGEDYFEYVRRHIYAPAGMNDTDAYEMDRVVPNLAIGYVSQSPAGAYDPSRSWNNLYLHVIKGGPAGGGFSTAPDLIRFATALTSHTLLDAAHTDIVLAPKVDPEWGNDELYAYGFGVRRTNGVVSVGHSGGFAGVNATLHILPRTGYAIAAMSNYDPPGAQFVAEEALELVARQ